MRLAKIENGVITNIIIANEMVDGYVTAHDHNYIGQCAKSDGTCIETCAPSKCHEYVDDAWVFKSVDDVRSERLSELKKNAADVLRQISEAYSEEEISTWASQAKEGRAWKIWNDGGQTGTEPSTPMIDAIVSGSGNPSSIVKSEIVNRIVFNADAADEASGNVLGQRIAAADAIRAATTAADVVAVSVEITTPVVSMLDK